MGITVESTEWLSTPLFPGRIGIRKCWFLRREENRSTRRKTLGAEIRTNNKLNPSMTPRLGIEPGPHWWEASALTTAPSLHLLIMIYRHKQQSIQKLSKLLYLTNTHQLTNHKPPSSTTKHGVFIA